jgi:hypothetical protein
MLNDPALILIGVAVAWFVLFRRHSAYRLRTDLWSALATVLLMPALIVKILWEDLPEEWFAAGVAPSFLMLQYSLYLVTVCEADKFRALRREIPRWRFLTGTPPKGYSPARLTAALRDRALPLRTLTIVALVATGVGAYATFCFGWGSLIVLAVFFWAFMALYQFSFSPDNQ